MRLLGLPLASSEVRRMLPEAQLSTPMRRGYGTGMVRRFVSAISSMRPTPPSSTILVVASAKPSTSAREMWGGIDSAFGSVTRSTRTAPLWAGSSAWLSASRTSRGFSTHMPSIPMAFANRIQAIAEHTVHMSHSSLAQHLDELFGDGCVTVHGYSSHGKSAPAAQCLIASEGVDQHDDGTAAWGF